MIWAPKSVVYARHSLVLNGEFGCERSCVVSSGGRIVHSFCVVVCDQLYGRV